MKQPIYALFAFLAASTVGCGGNDASGTTSAANTSVALRNGTYGGPITNRYGNVIGNATITVKAGKLTATLSAPPLSVQIPSPSGGLTPYHAQMDGSDLHLDYFGDTLNPWFVEAVKG